MDSRDIRNTEKEFEKLNQIKSKNKLINIKSDYFIQLLFNNIPKKVSLKIIKNNINIQKRLNINIKNYKDFCEKFSSIELEIVPIKNEYGAFINIKEENKKYFHIYFNGNKEEIKKKELNKEDKVSKITIIIDHQIDSFDNLFNDCKCIEKINFKKFKRTNITNMSSMFHECSSLKEINLSNFNTNNVTDMNSIFYGCSSLNELNFSKFNTSNVIHMNDMFSGCSSLKEINLSNFNTNNVTDMSCMFSACSSLNELDLSNFKTNNVTDMNYMFFRCSSLKKLNISNFNTNNVSDMNSMFYGCSSLKEINISYFNISKVTDMDGMLVDSSDELKLKILTLIRNFLK